METWIFLLLGFVIMLISVLSIFLLLTYTIPSHLVSCGRCGNSATWELYDNGTLKIHGHGPMYDFDQYVGAPWLNQKVKVKRAVLSNEISKIGDYAFSIPRNYNPYLKETNIPSACIVIGHHAFDGCIRLKELGLPTDLKLIGDKAIRGCVSLKIYHGIAPEEDFQKIFYNSDDYDTFSGPIIAYRR